MARISLIAMATLLFSVFFHNGLYRAKSTDAAVALGTAWSTVHAAAPGTALARNGNYAVTSSGSYTAGGGANRLLLVAVYYELATASAASSGMTVTIGGQAVTQIATTTGTARLEHVWLGYVLNANIPATASTVTATFSKASAATTVSSVAIKVGTYTGVNQTTPTTGSNANYAAAVTVASNASISYSTGGKTIVATGNGGVTATPAYTATPALTTNSAATSTTGQSAYIAESASHASAGSYASGGISTTYSGTTTAYSALAAVALNPAVTTLGNGVAGTSTTVCPGAAGQKIDGFSLVTGSAGTTDSITGLTVTTTNQAAIASMQIWDEAGTTQYFSTVSNPGSNTWSFSGGTPIPVTNTSANYKIQVTYKTRAAGAPTGSTTTTASVTALTGGNVTSGTDTADTTLTLSNTHAASTWGTTTAGDTLVALNWTYGTPGQSVIVVRYTTNTDTTKPTDGTTYGVNSALGTGTVRYNGPLATLNDTTVSNGTTYYYKIFEYDSCTNYYNATDVWTSGLTPVSSDPTPPTVQTFAATTPVNTTTVPITSFTATDNIAVAGYLITTTSSQPSAGAGGWNASAPSTFSAAGEGTYTLYPWAKDAANNVSAVYASPKTVVVDLTAPTVSAFTVSTQSASRNIPISSFTGSDALSGVAAYMITESSTPPAAGAAGWTGTAPSTYPVGSDGSFTLYPWVKDNAGNVSAVFGSPRTVLVDTAAPTGLAASSPADEATDQPTNVALQCTTASDVGGVGDIMYWFQVSDIELSYSQNSGWIAGTSFSPSGLLQGVTYTWSVKAKDGLGNETALTAPRSFTTTAPCVRNDPTATLLTGTGGTAATITSDGGTTVYNLKITNNDFGSCGSTTFNLSVNDTDLLGVFQTPSTLGSSSVTLNPGANTTTTVTVMARPDHSSGSMRTTATVAADAFHAAVTTQYVQTTLNVVGCTTRTPLLIVGPSSGYVNKGGTFTYTVTVKNTDTGTGCSSVTYNLAIPSESNSTDFNASSYNNASLSLNAGQLGSTTLTVSAKAGATKNAVNLSSLRVTATGHATPSDVTVTTTVTNPMLHSSDSTGSTKWSGQGGWGVPGGKYGEFVCETCHTSGGSDTRNIRRVIENVTAPDTSKGQFPGAGSTIQFRRVVGTKASDPTLGWDSGATPRASSSKICEVCHTYDAASTNGVKAHPYTTGATLVNHYSSDGKDCIKCHKHNAGFGVANMACNGCHGDSGVATITPENRYVVAPPTNLAGLSGSITGSGLVSDDPKVGAHQTHLRYLNGFSNYSTADYRCEACHGTLPTNLTHANGSSSPAFQALATKRGAMTATWTPANLTCNTYCHNPAGSGGTIASANGGFAVFPSWTSSSYLADGTQKTQQNCNRCHKSPGDSGFTFQSSHTETTVVGYDCSGCHGHNGDTSGEAGKRHMDGIRYAAGNCDSCHGYDTISGGSTWTALSTGGTGAGAHAKHINFIKTRLGIVSLTSASQTYGLSEPAAICGTCHTNTFGEHQDGQRHITFGYGGTTNTMGAGYSGSMSLIFGTTPSFNTSAKTCSNLICHYSTTPSWY